MPSREQLSIEKALQINNNFVRLVQQEIAKNNEHSEYLAMLYTRAVLETIESQSLLSSKK